MTDIASIVIFLLTGAAAGVLAGLLGIGGGLLIVPVLAEVFTRFGIDDGMAMQLAVGTSLATIVATATASTRAHHRRGAVRWPIFWNLTPGVLFGAALGAGVASFLSGGGLRVVFGIFAALVAVRMLMAPEERAERPLPGRATLMGVGSAIGTVSALVGIAGGTMTVPFLTWCSVSLRHAVATSAAVGLPIAVAGSIAFVVLGQKVEGLPDGAVGFVYWPALAAIVITSIPFARAGAYLAHTLATAALSRVFALFLLLVSARMLTA